MGEGRVREFGMGMYTLLYLKQIINKVLLYSTGNSAQYYVTACMRGGVWGRMDPWTCMAESLLCTPEAITMLLIGCTITRNKHFLKKEAVKYH